MPEKAREASPNWRGKEWNSRRLSLKHLTSLSAWTGISVSSCFDSPKGPSCSWRKQGFVLTSTSIQRGTPRGKNTAMKESLKLDLQAEGPHKGPHRAIHLNGVTKQPHCRGKMPCLVSCVGIQLHSWAISEELGITFTLAGLCCRGTALKMA